MNRELFLHIDELRVHGENFRQGIRKGPVGEDLIIWIRLDRQKPVKIMVGRADSR